MNARNLVAQRRRRIALPAPLAVLAVLAATSLLVGAGHASAAVQRGASRDQVETATEKLAKEITAWNRALTQSRASDWPTFATSLDRRVAALRSTFDKWERVLDQYIPDHLGDRGVPTLGQFQVAVRAWVPDQEAFVVAAHACIDPVVTPVDDAAVRSCLTQYVEANRSQLEQHEKAIRQVLRRAKRIDLD